MNRKESKIRPLLAARLKPRRRPPLADGLRSTAPTLRLSHDARPSEVSLLSSTSDKCITALKHARQTAAALRAALDAIELIQRHLIRLNNLTYSANNTSQPARDDLETRQIEVDREIQAIDRIANSTTFEGDQLLNGKWSATLADPSGNGAQSLRIPCMLSCDLGNKQIGGLIASLASGGEQTFQNGNSARILAVTRCALLQTVAIRDEVSLYLKNIAEPLIGALNVAAANVNAVQVSIEQTDWVNQVSRLTKLDALTHACPDSSKMHIHKTFSIQTSPCKATEVIHESDNNHHD